MLLEKLALPLAGRRLRRLRRLAPARDRRRPSTPRPCASSTAAARRRCSTPRASRCAWACRPSRCSSRRTSARRSALVGQEFNDDDDFLTGLETIAEPRGAERPDHARVRLLGAAREPTGRRSATAPPRRGSIPSRRSAPATSCSPPSSRRAARRPLRTRRSAPRRRGRAPRRRSRSARGRFEPREAGRLIGSVEVAQLRARRQTDAPPRQRADTCRAMKPPAPACGAVCGGSRRRSPRAPRPTVSRRKRGHASRCSPKNAAKVGGIAASKKPQGRQAPPARQERQVSGARCSRSAAAQGPARRRGCARVLQGPPARRAPRGSRG